MKVLALVTDAFGGAGGIACYNRDLLVALAAIDSVETIRVLPRQGSASVVDAKLHQIQGRQDKLGYSATAISTALSFRPDRIFCGHLFMLPLARLVGRLTGAPVWLQLHGVEAWVPPSRMAVRALACVDMVTCVSRYTRQQFLSWAAVDPSRVRVLPNTVSPAFAPGDRKACRETWELGDRPVLLTVGRLASTEQYKGHDRVLRCLPGLLSQLPSLVYLIAGTGDDRERLETLAQSLAVSDSVRFLGAVDFDALPGLFTAADLFVMPSSGEGFGIVYLEAMACGTPALGLDVDGSRDPLRDGDLGIVTSAPALCAAILSGLAAGRSELLAPRVLQVFGPSAFQQHVCRLFHNMVAAPATFACAA